MGKHCTEDTKKGMHGVCRTAPAVRRLRGWGRTRRTAVSEFSGLFPRRYIAVSLTNENVTSVFVCTSRINSYTEREISAIFIYASINTKYLKSYSLSSY